MEVREPETGERPRRKAEEGLSLVIEAGDSAEDDVGLTLAAGFV